MDTSIQISVKDLNKIFKTHKRDAGLFNAIKGFFKRDYIIKNAVKNINFSIKKGERVAIIGPNGAGKSTTVKMLTGILKPSSGKISVLGFNPFEERKKIIPKIGVIFGQRHNLWWNVPAIDSYHLFKEMYNISDDDFKKRLKIIKKKLGIKEYLNTPVRKLSLGERMRCELGLIFMHNPEIVFLDEPTIGIDVVGKKKVREFLVEINKEFNTTILLTSHDMIDVDNVCKRAIIISDGKILYDGKIGHLKRDYIDSKTLHLKFNKELNQKKLFGKDLIQIGTARYKIIFDKKKDISKYLKKVLEDDSKEVIDISIIEADLNEIIRNIFEGKRK